MTSLQEAFVFLLFVSFPPVFAAYLFWLLTKVFK